MNRKELIRWNKKKLRLHATILKIILMRESERERKINGNA